MRIVALLLSAALSVASASAAELESVTEDTFEMTVLDASEATTVVVFFWAEWCGPCRLMLPSLEAAATATGVRVVAVNIDEFSSAPVTYGVASIPVLAAFSRGQMLSGPLVGAGDEERLNNWLRGLPR